MVITRYTTERSLGVLNLVIFLPSPKRDGAELCGKTQVMGLDGQRGDGDGHMYHVHGAGAGQLDAEVAKAEAVLHELAEVGMHSEHQAGDGPAVLAWGTARLVCRRLGQSTIHNPQSSRRQTSRRQTKIQCGLWTVTVHNPH